MFYAHFVLAKKGPLARIWLAAHWDKKLTKAHVFETNIESSVEGILQPKVKMALRTSGHLLLGIVRIYSRKAKYLLADCNEAFIKIKMAFRPGVVDLPEENREAAVATITLPEVFHDFDSAMPEINIDMEAPMTLNQSRAEDITLKEDYGNLSLMTDDGFGDMGFDDPEVARDATNIDEGFDHASLLLGEDRSKEAEETLQNTTTNSAVAGKSDMSLDAPLKDDGFGGAVGEGLLDGDTGGLFEPAGLFDDAPLGDVPLDSSSANNQLDEHEKQITEQEQHQKDESDDDDMYDMGPASMGAPSPPSSPDSVAPPPAQPEEEPTDLPPPDAADSGEPEKSVPPPPEDLPEPQLDQTTLIQNEEETFALAPLDATVVQGAEKAMKAKRKRKLIVDEVKNISGEEMKSQLSDTTDIVTTLDLAPPTKRLMHWKETGGVEKLFALPGHPILSKTLSRMYQRHLTTKAVENEDFGVEEDRMELDDETDHPREDDLHHQQQQQLHQQQIQQQIQQQQQQIQQQLHHQQQQQQPPPYQPRKRRREIEVPMDMSRMEPVHMENSRTHIPDHMLHHPHLDMPPELMMPPPHPPSMYHNMPPEESMAMPQPLLLVQQHQQQMQQQMAPQQQQMPMMPQGLPQTIVPPLQQQLHPLQQQQLPISLHIPQPPQSMTQPMQTLPQSLQTLPPHMSQTLHSPIPQSVQQLQHPVLSESVQQLPESVQQQLQESVQQQLPESVQQQLQDPVQNDAGLQQLAQGVHLASLQQQLGPQTLSQEPPPHILNDEQTLLSPVHDAEPEQLQEQQQENELNHLHSSEDHLEQPEDLLLADDQNQLQDKPEDQETNRLQEDEPEMNHKPLEYPSDDDDDYGAPSSVGPIDEQQADETYEQFEERILSKRTTHMLHIIHHKMESGEKVFFSDIVRNNNRKQVAQKFYTFLVLKKQQAVELQQDSPYAELIITRGPKYTSIY